MLAHVTAPIFCIRPRRRTSSNHDNLVTLNTRWERRASSGWKARVALIALAARLSAGAAPEGRLSDGALQAIDKAKRVVFREGLAGPRVRADAVLQSQGYLRTADAVRGRRVALGRSRIRLFSTSVRSTRLGFLASRQFRPENPVFRALDCLGFPWILSSEIETYQRVIGPKRTKVFSARLPLTLRDAGDGTPAVAAWVSARLFMQQFNPASDFPQGIVVQALPSACLNPNATR